MAKKKATQKKKLIVKETVQASNEETKPVEISMENIEENVEVKEQALQPIKQAVKACEKVQDAEEHFQLNGKKMYWNNHVSIPPKGIVHGAVLVGDMKMFFAHAPKDLNLNNWMSDFDPIKIREDEAREKMKRKIGLKE